MQTHRRVHPRDRQEVKARVPSCSNTSEAFLARSKKFLSVAPPPASYRRTYARLTGNLWLVAPSPAIEPTYLRRSSLSWNYRALTCSAKRKGEIMHNVRERCAKISSEIKAKGEERPKMGKRGKGKDYIRNVGACR